MIPSAMTPPPITPSSINAALASYLDAATRAPFSWRTNNCCHFAAGWWLCMTGVDALAGFAMPVGPLAARHLLLTAGGSVPPAGGPGRALLSLVGCRTGRASVMPHWAQVGDLVAMSVGGPGSDINAGTGVALGICCGRTAVLLGDDGTTVHLPVAGGLCAWPLRVPA